MREGNRDRRNLKTAWLAFGLGLLALAAGCGSNNPTNPAPSAPVTLLQLAPTATGTPTSTPGGLPGPTWTFTPSPTPTFTGTPTSTWTPVLVLVTYTPTPTMTATTCADRGVTQQTGYSPLSAGYYYTDKVSVGQTTVVQSLSLYCYDGNGTAETGYLALYDAGSGVLNAAATFTVQFSDGPNYKTVPIAPVTLAIGNYNMVALDPTGTTNLSLGQSSISASFDYGTYPGGLPPANYSTLAAGSLTGGFITASGPTLYFTS